MQEKNHKFRRRTRTPPLPVGGTSSTIHWRFSGEALPSLIASPENRLHRSRGGSANARRGFALGTERRSLTLTVSCECRAVTFRRCELWVLNYAAWLYGAAAFSSFAQRRVAAGAAIETLSISFELFENEICSGQGAAPFYPSLSRIKFLASLWREARPRAF